MTILAIVAVVGCLWVVGCGIVVVVVRRCDQCRDRPVVICDR